MNHLRPAYDFGDCDSSVLLQRGQLKLQFGQNEMICEGEARLDFAPVARIRLHGYFEDLPKIEWPRLRASLEDSPTVYFDGIEIPCIISTRMHLGTEAALELKGVPREHISFSSGENERNIQKVAFHLFNFREFMGSRFSIHNQDDTAWRIAHIDLAGLGWNVELRSMTKTSDALKLLRANGGYQLTHLGSIERHDGSPFSNTEAEEVLKLLRVVLSFSAGYWCVPVCPVGYDASGDRIWAQWIAPYEMWRPAQSWFDAHEGSQVSELFVSLSKRWASEPWRESLTEVIYWYLNANNGSRGLDAGIILTQTAIERLSFEYVVKHRNLLTANGFTKLWASDKFRLLFSSLQIPLDIPAECAQLEKASQASNWQDAPHALTEIRNSLVHPEHKRRDDLNSFYAEAWKLGLWYLELAILAICGYAGAYGNRLRSGRWVGQVDPVPWAANLLED